MNARRALGLLAAAGLLAAGCERAPAPSARPLVVASFYPLWEFARQVAGEDAEVVSLVPAGVEPHDWEPAPQDLARVERARVFIYNGGGLEPWVDRVRPAPGGRGPLVIRATEGIALLPAASPGGRVAAAPPPDPHVWLDPVLVQDVVDRIQAALAQADPPRAAAYAERAQAFTGRLRALDATYAAGLRDCARREVVASHAAFGYLARRYGFAVVSVMGVEPGTEPSPAELAAIVKFARGREVKYIFFEPLMSPRLAQALAREVGARTLVFNPIEGLTREEAAAGKGYLRLMEENLDSLRTALECR